MQCNILVNDSCRACLTDFGVSNILAHTVTVPVALSTYPSGTMRWMAPELISADPEDQGGEPTTASDIYALSMVFWEVKYNPFFSPTAGSRRGRSSQASCRFTRRAKT
jgi:serine/threonine protein kinase